MKIFYFIDSTKFMVFNYPTMKKILTVILSIFFPIIVFAAVTNFVANGNITVSGVTFGLTTANMIIMNGSTAESWSFNNGAFTAINPGSAFNVGSSDASVKSIQVTSGSTTLVCSQNTTPGTSYATLPTTPGTYTVLPSATVQCTSLCATLPNTATYNTFPTCGALSCNSGYTLSGSGASATCVTASVSSVVPVSYLSQGSLIVPTTTTISSPSANITNPTPPVVTPVVTTTTITTTTAVIFTASLHLGSKGTQVVQLQNFLVKHGFLVIPKRIRPGYFWKATEKAVMAYQQSLGLEAVGYLGPKTRAALNAAIMGSEKTPLEMEKARQEQIRSIIEQILKLIVKLQEELAILKASGAR